MVQTITRWEEVVAQVKREFPGVSNRSEKFKRLVAMQAEKLNLSSTDATNLALFFGIKCYPRPCGVPVEWKVIFCKSFLSQRYVNPTDSSEYVVVVVPDYIGKLPNVIHRTKTGWIDARWFYEVVPELATIVNDNTIGLPFSMTFNETVNQRVANNNKKMTLGQLNAINLFFEKYVPSLEGICPTCYQVMLPKSGAGEKWIKKEGKKEYEIRLSATKPMARFADQREEYVSQTIINDNGDESFAFWNIKKKQVDYSDNMRQGPTHIPWTLYDFSKFNLGLPLCQCKILAK